jgi:hypothetical protein
MRNMSLIAIAVFIIGCNAASCGYDIDPELMPYVVEFEEGTGRPVNVDVKFNTFLDPQQQGNCRRKVIGVNEVTISPDIAGEILRFAVYHELGHCVLNKKRDDKLKEDGCPSSLMFPIIDILNIDCYTYNREHYLKSLIAN